MKQLLAIKTFLISGVLIFLFSCEDTDLLPPVIELIGEDSLKIQLNNTYTEQGATAIDDTEGDISSSIFINNPVNTNLIGNYEVTYSVTDKSGNEAISKQRFVTVYNGAENHIGNYNLEGSQVFPEIIETSSICVISIDSTVNNRIKLSDFCISACINIYADVSDTNFIIPFQAIEGFEYPFNIQGMGTISDTLIKTDCIVNINSNSELWQLNLYKSEN